MERVATVYERLVRLAQLALQVREVAFCMLHEPGGLRWEGQVDGSVLPALESMCRRVMETAAPLTWTSAELEPVDAEASACCPTRSYLGVPVMTPTRQVVGCLYVVHEPGQVQHATAPQLLSELAELAEREVAQERWGSENQKRAHELSENVALLSAVLRSLPDTVVVAFDLQHRFLVCEGGSALAARGLVPFEMVGKTLGQVCTGKVYTRLHTAYVAALEGRDDRFQMHAKERMLELHVTPLRDATGAIVAGLSVTRDITEQVEAAHRLQEQARDLRAMSLHDELTGLCNRRGYLALATQQLKLAARTRRPAAILFVDVDDLKQVNDALGHEQGDSLLRDAASVLRTCFRESDVVARLGGDEFAVLTLEISEADTVLIGARIRDELQRFNAREARPYVLSFSIGIVRYDPLDPAPLEQLLARADKNMYSEKQERKRRISTSALRLGSTPVPTAELAPAPVERWRDEG